MNLVYIHIGDTLPSHLQYSIEQARKWYDGEIYILFNEVIQNDIAVLLEKYECSGIFIERMYSNLIDEFERISFLHEYGKFWDYTMRRLIVLSDFMKYLSNSEVVHIENDVLIYSDPRKLEWSPRGVAVNAISKKYAGYGYCMIRSWEDIYIANKRALKILREGKDVLEERYGEGMVNEMLIAGQMVKEGYIDALPTLPGPGVKYLYDGSAWGQYVGGTTNDPPGWMQRERYVGEALLDDKVSVEWGTDEKGRKYPYVVNNEDGSTTRLANLHIHSKNLKEYMS
jgi:hypothetical protein